MTKIKNLIGSPLDIETVSGPRVLPAYGEIEAELAPGYLEAIGAAPYIEVIVVAPEPEDGDLEQWRTLYTETTGKKPHHLWKAPRIMTEIENHNG